MRGKGSVPGRLISSCNFILSPSIVCRPGVSQAADSASSHPGGPCEAARRCRSDASRPEGTLQRPGAARRRGERRLPWRRRRPRAAREWTPGGGGDPRRDAPRRCAGRRAAEAREGRGAALQDAARGERETLSVSGALPRGGAARAGWNSSLGGAR